MGWNPGQHPRYPNGRFRPRLSQSVRLSPISVSYNAGVRVPIVPGRANLYLGALARVERSGRHGGVFQVKIDKAVHAVSKRLGDPHGVSNLAQLLKGHEINTKGGLRVAGPTKLVNAPTFRVSSTPASRMKGHDLQQVTRPPRPRARARSRVAAVPSTLSGGIRTERPKAITKGPRRVRKSSTRGRKVRR